MIQPLKEVSEWEKPLVEGQHDFWVTTLCSWCLLSRSIVRMLEDIQRSTCTLTVEWQVGNY